MSRLLLTGSACHDCEAIILFSCGNIQDANASFYRSAYEHYPKLTRGGDNMEEKIFELLEARRLSELKPIVSEMNEVELAEIIEELEKENFLWLLSSVNELNDLI